MPTITLKYHMTVIFCFPIASLWQDCYLCVTFKCLREALCAVLLTFLDAQQVQSGTSTYGCVMGRLSLIFLKDPSA